QSGNTRIKYTVLCALASVSMAAIAGDRTGISVYGYSTEGYQRQIYGGDGVYQGYYQPPYYSPSPYGGYQPPYYRGYSEGYHDGYHQGQHQPSEPRHGTRFSDRRNKN
ncbi:MAG: hypothetical protein ACREV8_00650, partial [Gammaproteobacteria bacterium]